MVERLRNPLRYVNECYYQNFSFILSPQLLMFICGCRKIIPMKCTTLASLITIRSVSQHAVVSPGRMFPSTADGVEREMEKCTLFTFDNEQPRKHHNVISAHSNRHSPLNEDKPQI